MATWNESPPQNKHMFTTLSEYCQARLKCDHLKTNGSPYKPLHFSPCYKLLEPNSKFSDLIGTISAFNGLYLGHYFSNCAEICQ